MRYCEEKKSTFILAAVMLLLVMSGNDLGLTISSAAAEDDAPFTAKVAGTVLDTTTANRISLPATIVFTANAPVTIYYTTNGSTPTSSTSYVAVTSADSAVTGPTISSTEYMLLAQGVDATGSLTQLMTYTFINH